MTDPKMVAFPARRFVGYTTPFIHGRSPQTNAPQMIGALWGRLCGGMVDVASRVDAGAMFGVIWGEPAETRSHPHELHYLAGVEVERTDKPTTAPQGMVVHDVEACTMAVFQHHGPIAQLRRTLDHIYADWLPASPYEHAEVADVERIDDRFDPDADESVFDYAISVRLRTT